MLKSRQLIDILPAKGPLNLQVLWPKVTISQAYRTASVFALIWGSCAVVCSIILDAKKAKITKQHLNPEGKRKAGLSMWKSLMPSINSVGKIWNQPLQDGQEELDTQSTCHTQTSSVIYIQAKSGSTSEGWLISGGLWSVSVLLGEGCGLRLFSRTFMVTGKVCWNSFHVLSMLNVFKLPKKGFLNAFT